METLYKDDNMTEEKSYTDGMYDLVKLEPIGEGISSKLSKRFKTFKGTKYDRYRAVSGEYHKFYEIDSGYTGDKIFHNKNYKDFWYSGDTEDLIGSRINSEEGTPFIVGSIHSLVHLNDFISRDEDIIGDVTTIRDEGLQRYTTEQLKEELANRESVGDNKQCYE